MRTKPRFVPRFFFVVLAFAAACALYAAGHVASAQSAPKFNGRIAFTSNRDGVHGEIYTMRPDGSGLTNLTNAEFFDQNPSWQSLSSPFVPPTPTPTPTPATSEWTDVWEPYVPTPAQTEIEVVSCGGRAFVKVKLTFNNGGFRVTDWGRPVRAGNDFEADAKVDRWTGGSIQAVTFAETVYDLGELQPGAYRFTLTSHGAGVKSKEFTVGEGGASAADDAAVYIWQHYRDFLGRDPDPQGFRFWVRNMT